MAEQQDQEYRYEYGRRYHNQEAGSYYLPNDDPEIARLDTQHEIWLLTLDNALYRAPIDAKPKAVLDVGTGSGIWASEFAEQHPDCQVLGIDLSPVNPIKAAPANCIFRIQDAEKPWQLGEIGPFDMIHSRMILVGMRDWRSYIAKCYEHLKPGGWIELHELQYPMYSANPSARSDVPFLRWGNLLYEAMAKGGINGGAPNDFLDYLKEAGFEDIREEKIQWPIGSWREDSKGKRMGTTELANIDDGIEGFSMAALTKNLGWTRTQVDNFLREVKKDVPNLEQKYFHYV